MCTLSFWKLLALFVVLITGCGDSDGVNWPDADSLYPVIENPITKEVVDVSNSIFDDELVLGVVIDGKARAYPINMLTGPTREIINDELSDVAIAATW